MKKKELAVLIDGLRKLSALAAEIAASLAGEETPANKSVPASDEAAPEKEIADVPLENAGSPAPAGEAESQTPEAEPAPPAKTYTREEVRGILAEKARAGFREEVKALLTSRGVKQLSEITDPVALAALVTEAESIGNG